MTNRCARNGMNEERAHDAARNLVGKPEIGEFWSELPLEIWLRCGCCCVYCGQDVLASREMTYHFSVTAEHLLPRRWYPHLETEPSNLALACRRCNSLKAQFDPNTKGEKIYTASDSRPLTHDERQSLIARVRCHIDPKRQEQNDSFALEKKLILAALEADT